MAYPSPTTINGSEIGGILTYVNTVTSNWASNMFLIAIFVIFLMGYYRAKSDIVGGFAISGFVTFVIALLFWLGDFINGWTFAFTIAVMLVGVAWLLIDKNQ